MDLVTFSSIINFFILSTSVWLGWYILTRNTRTLITWLTALTLWSLSGFFLNTLLAANPPPTPIVLPNWLSVLFPFWAGDVFETGWSGWLMGWQVIPSIAFWHHITALLHPAGLTKGRKVMVWFVYFVAGAASFVIVATPLMFQSATENSIYLDSIKPGPLYPLFLGLLFLFTLISLSNILAAVKQAPTLLHRNQLVVLAVATGIAALDAPVAYLAVTSMTIPRVVLSFILGIPVLLIGYGVARYSSLMEGRTRKRDFYYNAVAIGLIVLIYLGVTGLSVIMFSVPPAAFVLVILLAITTHSLIDFARRKLDTVFYQSETRVLRSSLRHLSNLIGDQDLGPSFDNLFDSICVSIRATFGLALWFEKNGVQRIGTYHHNGGVRKLSPKVFEADDVTQLDPSHFPAPLDGAVLLIPMWLDLKQVGAVVLGHPENGT